MAINETAGVTPGVVLQPTRGGEEQGKRKER
jgi:hypothetical protein